MTKKETKAGRRAEKQAATLKEVEEAFGQLSAIQLTKLKKFAAYRVRGLGRAAQGRSGEDLLQEVFGAVFAGAQPGATDNTDAESDAPVRGWYRDKVDLFGLLHGAIESISYHWGKKLAPDVRLDSEFIKVDAEGTLKNTLKGRRSPSLNIEESMTREGPVVELEKFFEKDLNVSLILEGTKEGKSLPEIIRDFEMDEKEAKAADRKLRRKIDEMISKGKLNG